MRPIIKWPGGKSSEIRKIKELIPAYRNYVEPFFGGGALYFSLQPKSAFINDISTNLMDFYGYIKVADELFKHYIWEYNRVWELFKTIANERVADLLAIYRPYRLGELGDEKLEVMLTNFVAEFLAVADVQNLPILHDYSQLEFEVRRMVIDKTKRTKRNEARNKQLLSEEDLKDNLVTGIMSGLYMHFRNLYNKFQLTAAPEIKPQEKIANFYFIREFCYGSMFRYNSAGEFNIPYGGISYNRKDFGSKLGRIFQQEMFDLFSGTEIYNLDFEEFLNQIELGADDFVFLDPPYDTDFSNYEGKSFDRADQIRLAESLLAMTAKFILIIKNTDFIYNLYADTDLNILSFDKTYTYNVRSRNDRNTEHLIITNISS